MFLVHRHRICFVVLRIVFFEAKGRGQIWAPQVAVQRWPGSSSAIPLLDKVRLSDHKLLLSKQLQIDCSLRNLLILQVSEYWHRVSPSLPLTYSESAAWSKWINTIENKSNKSRSPFQRIPYHNGNLKLLLLWYKSYYHSFMTINHFTHFSWLWDIGLGSRFYLRFRHFDLYC